MAYSPPGSSNGASSADVAAVATAVTALNTQLTTLEANDLTGNSETRLSFASGDFIQRTWRDNEGNKQQEWENLADGTVVTVRPAGAATPIAIPAQEQDQVNTVVAAGATGSEAAGFLVGEMYNGTNVAVPVTVNGAVTTVAPGAPMRFDFTGRTYKQIDIDASGSATGNCWLNGSRVV